MSPALKAQIRAFTESSADFAINQSGPGREYATLDEAVLSHLNNIDDTMLEWGATKTREFAYARQCFESALIERGCSKQWVKS